ncbi:uncharacterized protein N7482_006653 [Penicillium canariense]|uniref:Uncharacterized protein n=1 Tax=Penicillium canariense TaxID=189055 RepID=A0A9W9LJC8_9EURO|nr:uncharacterized protein N7482_006653 [Penicillium canariense]KAJ5159649.1 hypothetical protein N7482_006653 [Penicillium canariense]
MFSQHDAVLTSHLEMLDSVKAHVTRDDEAFRTVSSMVTKTIQAMNQSKVARKYMLNRKTSDNVFNATPSSSSAPKTNPQPTPTPQFTDTETRGRRKRPRTEKEGTVTPSQERSQEDPRASKRRRDLISFQATEEDPRNASYASSGSLETEDISAEVQRRLRIKEERRWKKETNKPEKRKRESLVSTESVSPGGARHKKKRARTGTDLKRTGEPLTENMDGKTKRSKRPHNGG